MLEVTIGAVTLRLETEPGLFSPQRADAGTLAMLSRITFEPHDKVLDLGCGYGMVGILAAYHVSPTVWSWSIVIQGPWRSRAATPTAMVCPM